MTDPTTDEMMGHLSTTGDTDSHTMQRRSFLLAAAAGVSVVSMPKWMGGLQAAARPLNNNEGVLVLLTMGGGNDGLNTFVPLNNGAYNSARGVLAIDGSDTLALDDDRGFNKRLGFLKSKWDDGNVALLDGVGDTTRNDLSHFTSMAHWMQAAANPNRTGWLGRYIDQLNEADDPFHSVAAGTSIPLVVQGARRKAIAVPHRRQSVFDLSSDRANEYLALKALGQKAAGTRSVQQLAGQTMVRSVDLSGQLAPLIQDNQDEPTVVTQMRLAANLINANVGVRVISVIYGDFDSHSGQEYQHGERMDELNNSLQAFYQTLNPVYDDRTLVMGVSEFGRRVKANGSNGTDHGTANTLFAVGGAVKGGIYGQQPSLTDLDPQGNMKVHVDFRNVFSNIVDTWFNADGQALLGRSYDDIGFLSNPGDEPPPPEETGGGTIPPPTPASTTIYLRRQIARLYKACFKRDPDAAGEAGWIRARRGGKSLAAVATEFTKSKEFQQTYGSLDNRKFVELLYKNVLERNPDQKGLNSWVQQLDQGKTRGDLVTGFSESTEFQNKTEPELLIQEETGPIGRLYYAYFLRKPDTPGLHHWINQDLPTSVVSQKFTQSAEFKQRYGSLSNEEFIELVYSNVLERTPDEKGRRDWLAQLDAGKSRGEIMIGFSDSREFRNKVTAKYS